MAFKVKIDSFEGPFDLLLYLVSRKRVDIGAISITDIADQYIEEVRRMQNMDLDVASDFLLVAATLLELKAQALIPKDRDALDEDIAELNPAEAREMLVGRLIAYKQYKNAAEELGGRYLAQGRLHTRSFGPDESFLGLVPDFLEGIDMESLGRLAANAMARREIFLLESEHIAAKPIPVEMHVRSIHTQIKERKHMRFSELVSDRRRPELVVVTFLAILELYKRRMVTLEQKESFADISIDYIEGADELILDTENGITSVEE